MSRRFVPAVLVSAVLLLHAVPAPRPASAADAPVPPKDTKPEVTADDLRARVRFLADEGHEGRMSLEPGALAAATWVAAEFKRLGLVPIGDDGGWFQSYEIPLPKLGLGNALEVEIAGKKQAFAVETDWNPFSVSAAAEATGPLLFAGYGVVNPDKSYDDYAGVDAVGKVVIVFRKEPPWTKGPSKRAQFLAKLNEAAGKGAAALLVVNDEKSVGKRPDALFPWNASLGAVPGSGKIPFAFVSRATATALLAPLGKSLPDLQASIDAAEGGAKPASALVPGAVVRIKTAIERSSGKNARNVVGLLPGSDPVLKDQFVVLGAHHDHVGTATMGGSAGGPEDVGKVHPGADDNASGTAALLELAEAFATAKERPKRSLLFLSFSGEELGLLGSRHYVEHPIRPLDKISVMVNCDMVGRYREVPGLEVGGVGSGEGLQALVERANAPYALKIKFDPQGVAPSDNTSFFLKKVPVLFFFTGVHEQYHTPRDTWDTLSYDGAAKVTSLCRDVALDLANRDACVTYTTPPKRVGKDAALGIVPAEGSDAGVVVQGLVDDGPAEKAGILEEDVITAIGETVVTSFADLRRALAAKKPGDEVLVKVLRGGESKALLVTLGSR